jgi:hypothetical protein
MEHALPAVASSPVARLRHKPANALVAPPIEHVLRPCQLARGKRAGAAASRANPAADWGAGCIAKISRAARASGSARAEVGDCAPGPALGLHILPDAR